MSQNHLVTHQCSLSNTKRSPKGEFLYRFSSALAEMGLSDDAYLTILMRLGTSLRGLRIVRSRGSGN